MVFWKELHVRVDHFQLPPGDGKGTEGCGSDQNDKLGFLVHLNLFPII
jgi:hypothetical protein